MSLIC